MEIDYYYQRYREKIEIDVIGEQKWSIILGILLSELKTVDLT